MTLARRSVVLTALTLSLIAFLPAAIRAQTAIEVYPGPGADTYKSNLYTVEVFDGTNWRPSYVYQFSRKSVTYWWKNSFPSVSFTTFGTTGPVDVRVSKIGGFIDKVAVFPRSKTIAHGRLVGGEAIGTVNPNDKFWLVINGDDPTPSSSLPTCRSLASRRARRISAPAFVI